MTRNGRSLTASGVKPVCPFRQKFESTWLYGAFSLSGDGFTLEFPVCDSDCFQVFLDVFAGERPGELSVMVDNAAFHKAKRLEIPPNVRLIFLPPYSPELNPAEKIWAKFKRAFSGRLFETMDGMREFIYSLVKSLETKDVKSICACNYL